MLAEVTLEREDAGLHGGRAYQPRVWSRPSSPISLMSSPGIGSPRPRETFARTSGSLKCVVASTIARARGAGSSDLKMPEPDEHAVDAELHHERRVGRRREPAGREVHDRERPGRRDVAHELDRRAEVLGRRHVLLGAERGEPRHLAEHRALVANGLDDVAGARLALGADHRRALGDPAERLAEVASSAHERDGERPLVDVVLLVRGGEDLGLVDVVDAERLEDLRLDEVADPGLGHDRDRDDLLDLLDLGGVGHASDAAFPADVGGHALERHHGARAGVLGDLGLLGGGDVHDDAALQHLGQAGLHPEGAGLALHLAPSSTRLP